MAKKKATTKTSNRKPAKASKSNRAALPPAGDIPAGMKTLGGGFAPTWKPEEHSVLHGLVTGDVKTVEMTIGRKKQDRRCVEITEHDTQERFTVWESAALGELFDVLAEDGINQDVYIRFDGLGTAKKGQNPPKLFTVAIA
jgi:hypothetical protein